ncbi:hypothetical protein HCU64_13915 [Methylobacterium sp. C25]|uniref:winged helix-turn-helix domain-containing protein n=1 Tax=Methylobacterium sp. C25 TaxID=2721622 RepID=UPI001F17082E|nr:winged helix-turn-helix domain-containing protein [Methylobacterium sp. C25]MCE4224856.1 hypothetical protein [Methylobacterium sp. C25]
MVLSEDEAEAQLASLRRQRETLDRAIADLTLYLELGRRLTTEATVARGDTDTASAPGRGTAFVAGEPDNNAGHGAGRASSEGTAFPPASVTSDAGRTAEPSLRSASPVPPSFERGSPKAPSAPVRSAPQPTHDSAEEGLSEGVLARRYGRALIEAALGVLQDAGRPLHASEILTVLTGQGFSLPGHDPVAALNTRLWKRSGTGGPLKRMGEAVYALVEPEGG